MTDDVHSIDPDVKSDRAKAQMRHWGIRHLVVMKEGRVVGVLSDRDISSHATNMEWTVADLMTSHVIIAAPETSVRRAAGLLRGHTIGCLPVVDGKRLVGIVTTSDLLEHIARGKRAKRVHA